MTWALAAWSWLAGSKVGRAIAIAGGAVLAVLLIFWRGKATGRRDAELEGHRESAERVRDARDAADEARRDLGNADDGALDQRLRDHGL